VTLPACRSFLLSHPDAKLVLVGIPEQLTGFDDPRVRVDVKKNNMARVLSRSKA
jgi:glycerol-3-phosphate acyltransferase PlsX